jgi:putative transposase
VQRWVRRLRNSGAFEPLAIGGGAHTRRVHDEHLAALGEILAAKNDLTLDEVRKELETRTGLVVSVPTVFRALKKLGITRKKRSSTRPNKSGPTSSSSDGTFASFANASSVGSFSTKRASTSR